MHTLHVLHTWVWPETGVCRGPSPFCLCRGASVTNPCRGLLCRVLQSSTGLSQGGFKTSRFFTSLVAKRPPGPVTSPMILGRCNIPACIQAHIRTYSIHTLHTLHLYIHLLHTPHAYMHTSMNACKHACMCAYITLQYSTLHYAALHFITLQYITLRYITLFTFQ